jgi:diguanylate cyclase
MLLEIDNYSEVAQKEASAKTVVKATSQFLKATMREMDHVARYSDSRFALLLPVTSAKAAAGVAERLRTAIDSCKLPAEGGILKFTVSLAVKEAESTDDADSLLSRTITTLEDLVAAGGNQCNIKVETKETAGSTV